MTRKDCVLLAEGIAALATEGNRVRTARVIGRVCKGDNPRFRWSTWYAACNLPLLARQAKKAEVTLKKYPLNSARSAV